MIEYVKTQLNVSEWIIAEAGRDFKKPKKCPTFAFDTETQIYFDGKLISPSQLRKKTKKLKTNDKRRRLTNKTWAWQIYDEVNGFFMTNSFEQFLFYQCRCGHKFGWCYNSTFDFSQIDYQILSNSKWTPHKHVEKGSHQAYNKGQPWTYESVHNDTGARYAYKLWIPYHHGNRHDYTHAVEYRDFMKLVAGGLENLLKDLDVKDNEGQAIRKTTMEYQAVDTDNLTQSEIEYCCNDVKGLYFAIKQMNETIENLTEGECHIYGNHSNIMTAGGLAKREMLRNIYPQEKDHRRRLRKYQAEHPMTPAQDDYLRKNHLYRGGYCLVNPRYKGRLITEADKLGVMFRYDVNSEYPYAMAEIRDLVGDPVKKTMKEYDAMPADEREQYEAVYVLTSVSGTLKKDHLGVWYDPFRKDYVDTIDEQGTHLMFERELNELANWYDDLTFACDTVLLWKKGERIYAPFVKKYYALKAQAKKDHNPTMAQVSKLLINSSYGKLSERMERVTGHYEISKDTGAVHFVMDEIKLEANSRMNVAVGALITSFARCYILSKIREICGRNISKYFIYMDTDSVHAFAPYDKADAYTLGALKLEATCEAVKYIAPKTYIDVEKVNRDETVDFDKMEIHGKGVNISAIKADLRKKQKGKRHGLPTLSLIDRKMAYGSKFVCLVAMNVIGGKILLPTEKYLARPELAPTEDERLVYSNIGGSHLEEL